MASTLAQCAVVSTAARASRRAPARVSSGAPKTPMARRAVSVSRGLGVAAAATAAATSTKGKKADDSKNAEAKKALTRALAKGEPVKGRVEVANRGGLILRVFDGRFRAFLPLSQMASSRTLKVKSTRMTTPKTVTAPLASFDEEEEDFVPPPVVPAAEKEEKKARRTGKDAAVAALEGQVGKTIDVKITSVDGTKIVVSERALAQERGAKALEVGVRASGAIVSLSDFGAFVELSEDDPQAPRMEGLIHISELSWNRISHPRDVVRVGDCLLYTSPSPRDMRRSRMPSSA